LAGALMALTAQARANIFAFMLVFPLLAAWRWRRARQSSALLPLLGLAGALAMALPWGFVNQRQSGHFQMIPSAGGVNFYLGNKRGADGMTPEQGRRVTYGERYEDSVEVWARQEYEAAMRAEGRTPDDNPMAVSKYWTGRAVEEIKADPAAWLRLMARKCWLMLWNTEVPNNKNFAFLQNEFLWLRILPVRWVVLLMLAPAGIWAAAKWGNRDALFIVLAYAAIYSAGNVLFFVCDRYRYPVWPALAVTGGGGLLAIIDTVFRREWRGALGLAASMAAMMAVSLPNWFGAKLPSFARDYLFRSIAWYEKGHFPEALNDVNRSLELDPQDVTALHQRGNVLLALNRDEEARQDYERTLKMDSADAAIWNDYAIALQGLGRTNDAAQAFGRAIECHPPSVSAFLGLALLEIKSGQPNDAARTLDQLEKQEQGENAIALALRSVVARKQGNAPQADALEQQARALDPAAAAWAIQQAAK
jgi:Flp pilus assembly protein TadD